MKRDSNEYIGKRFGRLTVVGLTGRSHRTAICKCDCGNVKNIYISALESGVKSCGCLNRDLNELSKRYGTNLRIVDSKILDKRNKSGHKGVFYDSSSKKYIATIGYKGKAICLGRFDNKNDAIKAREAGVNQYFGDVLRDAEGVIGAY